MADQEILDLITKEAQRQAAGIELIPSENYASQAVRTANGSVFTNKYSEGYPGRRYYGGQTNTDRVEQIAIDRAKQLFGAQFANVQPHSGSNANLGVYHALLEPGDTVLGMDLSHGGHLTHGHPVTHVTKFYTFVRYGIKDTSTGALDYEAIEVLAKKHTPKILLVGYSAYTRIPDFKRLAAIAHEVGAVPVADMAHVAGLIAGGVHPNPLSLGFDVMTSTTHKSLRGPRGGLILVKDKEEIAKKIDKSVFPGLQGGPLMHHVAAKAVCFYEAMQPEFVRYAKNIIANAAAMAEVFEDGGVRLISGGTDNHMVLADVEGSLGVSGKRAQELFDSVGITLNMNMIPNDTRSAMDPSGIRFGTPAITSRGFGELESAEVARLMLELLRDPENATLLGHVRGRVEQLAAEFPIPDQYVS